MIKNLNLNEIKHVSGGGPEHWEIKFVGENPCIFGNNYAIVDTSKDRWIDARGAEYKPGAFSICRTKRLLEQDIEARKEYINKYGKQKPLKVTYYKWNPPAFY